MNFHPAPQPPDPVQDARLARLLRLLAVVCEQDREENPFGWTEPLPADTTAARR
ncbi:hypothetical protein OV450_1436 [Actinobacteria bacterium OV450]|nr:hypothetical protein OV450_1436 [Actinobacteria bacterium OV450]